MKRVSKTTRVRALAAQVGLATFAFVLLGAPSPGATGGCSIGAEPVADARRFCQDKQTWICERERAAGRTTDAEHAACVSGIVGMCASSTWPAGCAPTQATVDACIGDLSDPDQLPTPWMDIASCFTESICPPGGGGGGEPEGI